MKFSINQQIEEVERELDQRKSVYTRLVNSGKMRQAEADFHTNRMRAVLKTLEFCRDHRDALVEIAKEKSDA